MRDGECECECGCYRSHLLWFRHKQSQRFSSLSALLTDRIGLEPRTNDQIISHSALFLRFPFKGIHCYVGILPDDCHERVVCVGAPFTQPAESTHTLQHMAFISPIARMYASFVVQ